MLPIRSLTGLSVSNLRTRKLRPWLQFRLPPGLFMSHASKLRVRGYRSVLQAALSASRTSERRTWQGASGFRCKTTALLLLDCTNCRFLAYHLNQSSVGTADAATLLRRTKTACASIQEMLANSQPPGRPARGSDATRISWHLQHGDEYPTYPS